ncbi:hypothetical protein KL930_001685 [Ogataea haglerorum]|uniref:C2H2-type domain-containing protein n=1 Tax=Ogataea haglerorum TaxID=1937702 RepID=A0AAN6I296_9ASCO|nr:uncharacterized protein KL911_001627 [Ogataea haglerorum]KAG7698023.1 hypothetical protein KL915_001740 [Ogataea haglerorum]KAG7699683.1 hypothetical protein KL951_001400 [Ogataea haglerorum]KAG7708245.1 hypothetical protein KL914_001971 [Ogataea haglerorum]KAG7710728.1 hypothetical protein KL950_001641 [Ogataea haglerorum]KAG7721347.1 hypothetical protein KL913_001083 [Ogataea haglerorum]
MPRTSSTKKHKGRVFQCVGYENCSMSFTRSEHLARHIRKHTGERPFKCEHCARRFSRLDNLRQHKQTVHIYENFILTYPGENVNVRMKSEEKDTHAQKNPAVVQQGAMLPPPRRSILLSSNNEFRPHLPNKPGPIFVQNSNFSPAGSQLPTPTSSAVPSASSASSSRVNSPHSVSFIINSYDTPISAGTPISTKTWLNNVLNNQLATPDSAAAQTLVTMGGTQTPNGYRLPALNELGI